MPRQEHHVPTAATGQRLLVRGVLIIVFLLLVVVDSLSEIVALAILATTKITEHDEFAWLGLGQVLLPVEVEQVLDQLVACVQLDGRVHVHLDFAIRVDYPPAEIPR